MEFKKLLHLRLELLYFLEYHSQPAVIWLPKIFPREPQMKIGKWGSCHNAMGQPVERRDCREGTVSKE